MKSQKKIISSFRDPSGFLFYRENQLLRQINKSYKDNYDFFISSGLYEKLKNENLIISHRELADEKGLDEEAYKVIAPEIIAFISYPYEWSFPQLKDDFNEAVNLVLKGSSSRQPFQKSYKNK